MDVLSEVLETVRLDGAMFYNAEFSAPWCFRSPGSRTLAPYLSPGPRHVIIFHLLTEGRGYAHVEGDGRPVPLDAGDIVIFPHGDPHILGNGPPVTPVDNAQELKRVLSLGLKVSRMGGGGELTKFICGYMACDPQLSRSFLAGYHRLSRSISATTRRANGWKTLSAIRWIMRIRRAPAVRPYWPNCLKSCSLKRCDATSHSCRREQTGWLAGVRDPDVGKALALLHQKAGPSLDDRVTRQRGRSVTFRPGRAFPALSLGNTDGLSHTLAPSARRAAAQDPQATAWRRSLLRSAMNRSRRLTAPSNGSSASRRPASAANRNQLGAHPSALLHEQPMGCETIRSDSRSKNSDQPLLSTEIR